MSLTFEDLQILKLPDLKKLCKEKSLPSTGVKLDLITRLLDYEKQVLEAQSSELVDEKDLLDDLGVPTSSKPVSADIAKSTEKPAATPVATFHAPTTTTTTTKPVDSGVSKVVPANIAPVGPVSVTVPDKQPAVSPPVATASTVAAPVSQLSADERKRLRQERFRLGADLNGSSQPVDTLKKRAERFGEVTNKDLMKGQDEEKRQQRAQRFGVASTTSESSGAAQSSQLSDEERKRQRAARFNLGAAGDVASTADEKKLKRAARFGVSAAAGASASGDDAVKKQKRAERFGLTA